MIDPQVIVKANYNRTVLTIIVTAINSPDWFNIRTTRIDLYRDSAMTDRITYKTLSLYKIRAYIENGTPDSTIYGKVTMIDASTNQHISTFSFVVPHPILGTVKTDNQTRYVTSFRKLDKEGNLSPRNYGNKAVLDNPSYIDVVADADGEMIINNRWSTNIWIENITQNTTRVSATTNSDTTVSVSTGDIVRVTEGTRDVTFRTWATSANPFCRGVSAHISYMPAMNKFTYSSVGNSLGERAFSHFNHNGTLTSLPEGSFDLHKITGFTALTTSGYSNGAFTHFNHGGALTSLPEGSFDTSQITGFGSVGHHFEYFNAQGALTSLPDWSFDFDSVRGTNYSNAYGDFESFNANGALTSLPEGSFGFTSWDGVRGETPTFASFNSYGALTSLPAGAFHFKEGKVVTYSCNFTGFNQGGHLTSLPAHSFNFLFGSMQQNSLKFTSFNYNGALTSLPSGSFKFDSTGTLGGDFGSFNKGGALTSLPDGSFNTDNITALTSYQSFNESGALTSLPEGSFNLDKLKSVNTNGFSNFNKDGALTSLPKGSFSLDVVTSISTRGFQSFNQGGNIEYLPIGSFNTSGVTTYASQAQTYRPFTGFNYNGKLTKSTTYYNQNFILPTVQTQQTETAYYYDPATQTQSSETISIGNPFMYYEADYFSVSYSASPAFTTNLASSYLSGKTITFTAIATDPDYVATPSITTSGGLTIPVTNNGNNTYTFIMPQDEITVNFTIGLHPASITIVAEEAGTMTITNRWTTPVLVKNVTQSTPATTVAGNGSVDLTVTANDEITVTESNGGVTFRNWGSNANKGFVWGVTSHISDMPAMNRFTQDSAGTTAGNYFFFYFNYSGKLTSFPAGALDTSSITTTGKYFFSQFNYWGSLLTSLPAGSFDTSNISTVGTDFFSEFNRYGALTSLPTGSFNTNGITVAKKYFFLFFNENGALTSLPAGSFDTSNIMSASDGFFEGFNNYGELTSLPADSFDTSRITIAGNNFFSLFNGYGKLTSLPSGSFDISGVTSVGEYFFGSFNEHGKLTSLPSGSFNTGNIVTVGSNFFDSFNFSGDLTSLPAGSFDISGIGTTSNYFFTSFNQAGSITSLPAGSFNTSNIRTLSGSFFTWFNYGGQITALPAGSFDTSNITNAGSDFLTGFNSTGGKITKDTTPGNYNPNLVNAKTTDLSVTYYSGTTENVAPGAPLYFKTV